MQKSTTLRDFDTLSKLGQGAFGQVYKVKRREDGNVYAMKKIKLVAMKPKQRQNALNQIRILASYNGQYIIGYKQCFYDDSSSTLCIVMELANGGDLLKMTQTHIKKRTRFDQKQIWTALVHMTQALRSLHEKKVLHRDLKCANVFVTTQGVFKLGDLNVSKVLKKQMARTQTGTPYYASPEVWKDKPYGVKSDMWSLGCVLYEMAALKPPFTATDLAGLYKKICAGYFQRIPAVYSNDLDRVISSLLKINPNERPDTLGLLENALVHKNFDGKIDVKPKEADDDDFLLKTLKVNHANLRSIKNILPKANYDGQGLNRSRVTSVERIKTQTKDKQKTPITTTQKTQRQTPKVLQKSQSSKSLKDRKQKEQKLIDNYLQIKRKHQQKERQRNIQQLKDEKDSLVRKRQRVLSACGMRNNSSVENSPRRNQHEMLNKPSNQNVAMTPNVQRKDSSNNLIPSSNKNLPPKPANNNISYKMPPKPTPLIPSKGNISVDYNRPGTSRDRANSKVNNSSRDISARDRSKQNLIRAGQNILANDPLKSPKIGGNSPQNRIKRCSSAQKVVYPSWWID